VNELNLFQGAVLPAVFAQRSAALDKALGGGLDGGINRISIKGSRFRLQQGGQEVAVLPQDTLDVVIVGASPSVARTYYMGKYTGDDKVPPTCWSSNGKTPDAEVEVKQAVNCEGCKQNIKGSKTSDDGALTRACAFKKRIAVVAPSDLNEGGKPVVYAFDVNSISMFGEGEPNQNRFTLQGYAKFLKQVRPQFPNGIPTIAVVTRLTFDTNSSVPKLFFGVASNTAGQAAFLSATQAAKAVALESGEEVKRLLNVTSADLTAPEGDVAQAASAPVALAPPPPPVLTWQQVATDNGADADDIETIFDAGGPYTEKGRKRWDKVLECAPPEPASAAQPTTPAAPPKARLPKAKTSVAAAMNPPVAANVGGFGSTAPPAPVTATAPAQPVATTTVGAELAARMTGFDDDPD
jgi:hypothetical protein